MKKRLKNNFFGNSRNFLIALLVIAAFLTVYAQVNGAIVSHTADQIEPGYLSVTTLNMLSGERPESPAKGDIYLDQNDNELYYYSGEMWMRLESVPSGTGTECSVAEDCESGFCVDGYCCDSACDTTCYSCNVPGLEGYCTELTDMTEDGGCSSACRGCYNGACTYFSNGAKDTIGINTCTNTHYRCNGAGSCTAPKSISGCIRCNDGELGKAFSTVCLNRGYDGCYDGYCAGIGCSDNPDFCNPRTCSDACYRADSDDGWQYASYKCWNWVYD